MRTDQSAERAKAKRGKPYRVKPASLGGAAPGIDLDKALALADALEDQAIAAERERCDGR
jgi:hypothetical protein